MIITDNLVGVVVMATVEADENIVTGNQNLFQKDAQCKYNVLSLNISNKSFDLVKVFTNFETSYNLPTMLPC